MFNNIRRLTSFITMVTAIVVAIVQLRQALRTLKGHVQSSDKANKYSGGYNPV